MKIYFTNHRTNFDSKESKTRDIILYNKSYLGSVVFKCKTIKSAEILCKKFNKALKENFK